MRQECRERFACHRLQRKPLVIQHASRHVRDARAVMPVGNTNPRCRGKRSRHYQRMRNTQLYAPVKRPIAHWATEICLCIQGKCIFHRRTKKIPCSAALIFVSSTDVLEKVFETENVSTWEVCVRVAWDGGEATFVIPYFGILALAV